MLIAHLPAGYIIGSLARQKLPQAGALMLAAMVGSVAPDFDIAWFLFVDNGSVHHRDYPTHWPLFWALVAAVVVPLMRCRRRDGRLRQQSSSLPFCPT
ncbi:metal-dependent hydrolase [Mesorhizobium sp. CC13]|uniref:metal-dependent hydrolase n=1 Tax=Mesorhizobium sp. CC13 TaxID=3029194 RepID=UPI0032650E3A